MKTENDMTNVCAGEQSYDETKLTTDLETLIAHFKALEDTDPGDGSSPAEWERGRVDLIGFALQTHVILTKWACSSKLSLNFENLRPQMKRDYLYYGLLLQLFKDLDRLLVSSGGSTEFVKIAIKAYSHIRKELKQDVESVG
jgi:hypothetical protein